MKMILSLISIITMGFFVQDFLPLKGFFKRGKATFTYTSTASFENGTKWIVTNTLNCDADKPFCLNWPVAQMFFGNKSPYRSVFSKRISVISPSPYPYATIYFGVNLKQPQPDVKCYVDGDKQVPADGKFTTDVRYSNEIGESLAASVNSMYIPQLKTTAIELDVNGAREILIEKKDIFKLQDSLALSKDWSVSISAKSSFNTYDYSYKGSDSINQMLQNYLQPLSSSTKLYYHLVNFSRNNVEHVKINIVANSESITGNDFNLGFLTKSGLQTIAFSSSF